MIIYPGIFCQSGKSDIEIIITGFRNYSGTVNLNLFKSGDGFPDHNEKSLVSGKIQIISDTVIFHFKDMLPGKYAVSVLHDENGNGKMEKNLLGKPREGFAFSNNYKPVFSSPSFSDVAFTADQSKIRMDLQIIYF